MAGRPSILTPELKARAAEYVERFAENGDVIPSAAGLAVWLKISKASVYNFGAQDDQFLDTLNAIQAKQEAIALNNGLLGEFNAMITKLVLANHGYSDRVQQDVTSSDGSMTPKDHSVAVLEALQAKHK